MPTDLAAGDHAHDDVESSDFRSACGSGTSADSSPSGRLGDFASQSTDDTAPRRFAGIAGCTALVLSFLALGITIHATTDTQPTRNPSPAPTLVAAPSPGEPLPAAVSATVTATTAAGNRNATPPVDPLSNWAHQRAATYGIPEQALYAYGHATVTMQAAQPDCHLGWTTLAAIANTESNHARFGGATIGPSGLVSPPIRGVPLDGTRGNATITTSGPGGRSGYARAEGPFQFIPDTWKRWGIATTVPAQQLSAILSSGTRAAGAANGNPDNINDAALTAARYLCADHHDLATPAGWTEAILAYNHSTTYLDQIHGTANRYGTRSTGG